MARFLAGIAFGLAFAFGSSVQAADPSTPTSPRIFGGEEALPCQWPTTVLLTTVDSLCSGVLVHPQLVVTAAHCIDPNVPPFDVKFGERHNAPARKARVDFCKRSPNYSGEVGGYDIGFCKLLEPVEDVPPTPVAYGCETSIIQAGWPVTIVGFGKPDEETQAGTKRFAETAIFGVGGFEGLEIQVGEAGTAGCNGDSGGPAYVQYPNDGSWHVIGVLSGGPPGCGVAGRAYVMIHPWIPWMELASGLDLTPCYDREGNWDPGPQCGGFALDPLQDQVVWEDWCASALSEPSDTCEPMLPPADEAPPDGCDCGAGTSAASPWLLVALLGLRRRSR